jgi:hypothetical protein
MPSLLSRIGNTISDALFGSEKTEENASQSPYEYYLELLGQWPTSIALASQWMVHIHFNNVNSLFSNIQQKLIEKEQSDWQYNGAVTKLLIDGGLQARTDNMMGCVFARQVVLPSENVDAGNLGLDYGAYLPPAVAGKRGTYDPLSITLLETNASFLDFIIRPWIMMVGYNGLIARSTSSDKNVKAMIDVVMYGKTGYGYPMGIRKIFRFYNAAPIAMGGETYSYNEEGLRYSDVKFVYDKYAVSDGNSGTFIYLQ